MNNNLLEQLIPTLTTWMVQKEAPFVNRTYTMMRLNGAWAFSTLTKLFFFLPPPSLCLLLFNSTPSPAYVVCRILPQPPVFLYTHEPPTVFQSLSLSLQRKREKKTRNIYTKCIQIEKKPLQYLAGERERESLTAATRQMARLRGQDDLHFST